MTQPPALASLQGARILVTGGAGFLGRHVMQELASAGARAEAVRRSEHDLTDAGAARSAVAAARPDVVVHLAATVGGIAANRDSPATFFRDNMLMGLAVIDACLAENVTRMLMTGTVCAYPAHARAPFVEDELWNGYPEETNAPYGIAKRALLVHLEACHREHGLSSAFLLPANLYGPGDDFDPHLSHVIPALVKKFSAAAAAGAKSVTLWGDGTPTREFLHVRDAARACALATSALLDGRCAAPVPMNIGTGVETSISELASLIADLTGFRGTIAWDVSQPNGQLRRQLDISRAREVLGFEAHVGLADGLSELVAWYRERASAEAAP